MTEERAPEGAADPPPRLEPAEAEAILAVRGLLDEALSRAADSTVVGRRVAAVLMDGAAEAAMAAGLGRFNDSPKERDKFDELHRRLVEHLRQAGRLGSTRGLDGWPEVRRLRLARNGAQHHQIPPDHQTLVTWSAGVRRFVAHVVASAFEVDLTAVSAASAIEHDDLRAGFVEAEKAQAQGDTRGAVKQLQRVFADARRLWAEQRRSAIGMPWTRPHDELGLANAISDATRHLDETLTVAPFALDLGEFIWWQRLLRDVGDDRVVITAADTARAVAFVFTWVVRWESFSARYIGRERLPSEPPDMPPPSRRTDGAAELDSDREPTVEVRFERRGFYGPPVERWVFRVPYRLGGPEDASWQHGHLLDQELYSQDPPPPWKGHISRYGADIQVPIDPGEFDAGAVLDELEQRFERARLRQEQDASRAAAVRTERQQIEDAVAEVAPEVLSIRHNGEQPFAQVTVDFREAPYFVLAKFTDAFVRRFRDEVINAQPKAGTLPEIPAPARMRYDGFEVPLGHLHELRQLAVEGLDAIDNERARIRGERTETLLLAETLDAAAKAAMSRRQTFTSGGAPD